MARRRGFDQQSHGFEVAQDIAQLPAELQFADAAQTPAFDQAHVVVAACRFRHAERIDSGAREFVEYDHPQFVLGLMGHEPAYGGGLAPAETAGDNVNARCLGGFNGHNKLILGAICRHSRVGGSSQYSSGTMNHPLQCKCGTIKAVISNSESANRAVCYCKDCQDFARFLGQERETLDARGGSDIVQILPKNVAFLQGMDSLACMRLTSKGMVRWYAACCKTPIGNTLANYKISFIGLLHNCLESPDHPLQNSFGPVRCHVNGQGALGDPK